MYGNKWNFDVKKLLCNHEMALHISLKKDVQKCESLKYKHYLLEKLLY